MTIFFISILLLLSCLPAPGSACDDGGESGSGPVLVLDGESGWISCPLFSGSSWEGPGLSLDWSRLPDLGGPERPLPLSSHVSRDSDQLWFQPAVPADSGLYACQLRNGSSCRRSWVRLKVLPSRVQSEECRDQTLPVATPPLQEIIPLNRGGILDCPDLDQATGMSEAPPSVTWYKGCHRYPFWKLDIQPKDQVRLQIHNMLAPYAGLYFCRVQYQWRGSLRTFTRGINVTAVCEETLTRLTHPSHSPVSPRPLLLSSGLFP